MRPGTSLGQYRIVEALGAGGMGEVYRAHDPVLGRDVAIKVLPKAVSDDPERLARLRHEARALASLSDPRVATVHGFEEHQGTRFIVMELVRGAPLDQRLSSGALGIRESLEIALGVARGLEAAHDAGIVHRDLKPSNVMVCPDGAVKLVDFGLAKPMAARRDDSDSRIRTATLTPTRTGTMMGTAPYMSPEQIRGEALDERADVWAFGTLLYEMLTRQRAFPAETTSDTLAAVLRDEPDWEALPPETPTPVQRLLRRTLVKVTDRRLRHIADARIELEDALETTAGGGSILTERAGDGSDSPATTRARHATPVGAVTAAVGLGVAVVVLLWGLGNFGEDTGRTDRTIAVLPFETLGQEQTSVFTDGMHGDMLTRLSKVSGLSVTSRTSVMRFRNSLLSLPEIASELGVAWILVGEVQEVGGQVQVNARLMDAGQDRQVWAESYRRDLTAQNLFQIQGELTQQIAARLQARLTAAEEREAGRVPTDDLEAYRLYSQGRALLDQRTADDMRRALEYFELAIDRDPEYALAWAGLANSLSVLAWYGNAVPPNAPDPGAAARRAVELDPELAEAHGSLGIFLSSIGVGPAALEALERAVALRPSYAEAHIWLAWVNLVSGLPDGAVEPAERAAALDPLSSVNRLFLAETYLAKGRYDDALREARRSRELQPDFALARFMEGLALLHVGQLEEAEATMQLTLDAVAPDGRSPRHSEVQGSLGMIRAARGDLTGARTMRAELDEADRFSAGLILAALDELDAAFAAFTEVDDWVTGLKAEQIRYFFPDILAPLRADPRFADLLRRIDRAWGLTDAP